MKIYNFLLLTLIGFFIISCTGEAKTAVQDGDFKIELLFEKDGCKMYRFKDGGRYIYWTNCDGRTEYTYHIQSGKSNISVKQQSITSKTY